MPCYKPILGYRSRSVNESGKRSIVFNPKEALVDFPVNLPCGQCIGCRLERSRQWAIRCVHESMLHERNCFITLTYDDKHKPKDGSLKKSHFQDFMKRLRYYYPRGSGDPIRYFHCGEYGERFLRPHYHAIIFNHDFDDKYAWSERNGTVYYRSDNLEKIWPFGMSTVGEANFETAAYCARYITKKVTGDLADEHYERVCEETGECTKVIPEYTTMSRRPGIGRGFLDKFSDSVYPSDFVVIRGKKMKPPKYYDSQFELMSPDEMAKVKGKRKRSMKDEKVVANTSDDRLRVREDLQWRRFKRLKRSYENENL